MAAEHPNQVALDVALGEFVADCKLADLKRRVGFFVNTNPGRSVGDVKAIVFRAGERGPGAQDNGRRVLVQFFNLAVEKGCGGANPAAKIKPVKSDRGACEKCRAIVNAAAAHNIGALVPYVVLGRFCGPRALFL